MLSHVLPTDEAEAVAAVVTGLRWVAIGLGAYLVAGVVAGAAVHRLRWRRLAQVVDALSLPVVRRAVRALLGVGVLGGSLLASPPAPAGASVPVMRRLDDHAPVPPPPPAPPAPAPATDAPPSPAGEWTVRPGDHFWRIAEEVLARQRQHPPTDAETDPYWRRLVAANRDRLADRDNPDLLFPGQVLVVPPA